MKSRAYAALVDRGLLAVVPSFNMSSIVDVRPRKISIVVPVNTLASQMDGSDQNFETMLWETERLGHMTASVSAQLHDETTFLEPLALVQSSFNRPHIPKRGDTIYVTSESVLWEDGHRSATFEIVACTPGSRKIVGFGSDLLQIQEVHHSWRARQNGTEGRPSTSTSSEAATGTATAVEEQGSHGSGASETTSSNGLVDSNLNGPISK
ncbi:hypothetical protein CAEBREN_17731 [Caenorhabditis brenneri]|uniref:Uncharacterized protein n=1 Tax=Caenorhabditis brenneri TaxID=135651 RepID=G0N6H7_CAEBE|nr:hypothetical protein CAEBREN_17731 [Caenorhabditis brenneri]